MKNTNTLFYSRFIGFVGMAFPITANFLPPSDLRAGFFIIGGLLMFIAAAYERSVYFSVLQLIVLAGASMYFTPFSPIIKAIIPIGLTISFVVYSAVSGRMQDKFEILGAAAILALACGFAMASPLVYLAGGVLLTVYSSIAFKRGQSIAIIWAILNFIFSIAAIINIYYYVLH